MVAIEIFEEHFAAPELDRARQPSLAVVMADQIDRAFGMARLRRFLRDPVLQPDRMCVAAPAQVILDRIAPPLPHSGPQKPYPERGQREAAQGNQKDRERHGGQRARVEPGPLLESAEAREVHGSLGATARGYQKLGAAVEKHRQRV
jgi:hypothetical protein